MKYPILALLISILPCCAADGDLAIFLTATGNQQQTIIPSTSMGRSVLNIADAAAGRALFGIGSSYQATAAGTAYTLTASYSSVDFGTTDPSITLVAAGNYYLYVNISTAFNAATFAGVQSISVKFRRTSGTPADIGTPRSQPLPVITALTGAGPSIMVGPFPYTATANDVVTVQAILSATPGAGSVTVDACEITAIPR